MRDRSIMICTAWTRFAAIHIVLLIRDVAKLPVLLSPIFSDFFSTAVPYSSLIFSPFLPVFIYTLTNQEAKSLYCMNCIWKWSIKSLDMVHFSRVELIWGHSTMLKISFLGLLFFSTWVLLSLIFSKKSSTVSYWPVSY